MDLEFYKLQGTGNDFVLLDFIDSNETLNNENVQFYCDRNFGIGSDGLLELTKAENADLDFHLTFYNPDGSESFCGNGSRCAVQYYCTINKLESCSFSAFDGEHKAYVNGDLVKLEMNINAKSKDTSLGKFINTGAPHVCVKQEDLKDLEIVNTAKPIRWDKQFQPVGVNVNFYEKIAEDRLSMRTFEKGVEGETLSCGTGVTAVAISYFDEHPTAKFVNVETKGGKLSVEKDAESANKYWLSGPAKFVFKGKIKRK